ncbi:hypothetical protein ACFQ0T_08365 [Kitasatospora gansuensis]
MSQRASRRSRVLRSAVATGAAATLAAGFLATTLAAGFLATTASAQVTQAR